MGVPQGSIIGPFLFIIYINDLVWELYMGDVNMLLYDDDTILYTNAETVEAAVIKSQRALDKVCDWCSKNRLSLNIKKTKHMFLESNKEYSSHRMNPVNVYVDGEILDNVHSYNYLGVVVDDMLSFADFVEQKYNKVNMRLYQLKRLRPYITKDIACTIYKQTVVQLIDYADFMIESVNQAASNKLIKLQEKAVKYIDNNTNATLKHDELCMKYNIQALRLGWREHILSLMYRLSKKKHKLNVIRPKINLRSTAKVKFLKKRKRTYEIYLKSPMCRCSKLWEMLAFDVQRATTKVKFKTLIKGMCRLT